MTILVGMIGSDGIILAADRRMIQPAQDEKHFDVKEGICKIVRLGKYRVAYARAGDDVSRLVGDEILTALHEKAFDFASISSTQLLLEEIATSTVKRVATKPPPPHFNPNDPRSLLIVFYGKPAPALQLWRLRISPPDPGAEPIVTISVQGAIGNSARFFEHYYREGLPIEALTFLASHIVLTAGRVDSGIIEGLDVALFHRNSFRLLLENEKKPLRERSKRLNALIDRKFFQKSPQRRR